MCDPLAKASKVRSRRGRPQVLPGQRGPSAIGKAARTVPGISSRAPVFDSPESDP